MEHQDQKLAEISAKTTTNQQDQESVKSLTEMQLSIEDKAAHLSLQVNQIIIKPYLNQALDYLISSRDEVVASYHNLSTEIGQETSVLLDTNRVLAAKVAEAKQLVSLTQASIRNRYNATTEFEIATGTLNLDEEYNTVAQNYERSMQLSQEIIKNRMRIESLLETQRLLDASLAQRVVEIQLEIDNLSYLLNNLHDSRHSNHDQDDLLSQFSFATDLEKATKQQINQFGYDPSLWTHTSFRAEDLEEWKKQTLNFSQGQSNEGTIVDNKEIFVVKPKKAPVNLASKSKKK